MNTSNKELWQNFKWVLRYLKVEFIEFKWHVKGVYNIYKVNKI